MKQTQTREAKMQKPENITEAQWKELMEHFESQPKIKVTETGTLESRMMYSPEELQARRQSRR